jgi:hypothetical protein
MHKLKTRLYIANLTKNTPLAKQINKDIAECDRIYKVDLKLRREQKGKKSGFFSPFFSKVMTGLNIDEKVNDLIEEYEKNNVRIPNKKEIVKIAKGLGLIHTFFPDEKEIKQNADNLSLLQKLVTMNIEDAKKIEDIGQLRNYNPPPLQMPT